ncbi:hypothetical protein BH11BAC5_BH11BAC5_06460 [soil metagenome]
MQQENFSPQQSIDLIQSMISKTKNTVADSSVFFLLWGWVVFGACLLQYFLKNVVHYAYHYSAWLVILIGIAGSIYLGARQDKKIRVKTYIDESIDHLWISIAITFFALAFIFSKIGYEHAFTFYMLLYGIGCFITGRLIKFTPLVWGATGAWLLAIVSAWLDYDTNILITALSILVSYIIPGYLLRRHYKNNNKIK